MVFILLWIVWVVIGGMWYLCKESEYNYIANEIDKRIEAFERKKTREARREYRRKKGIKSPGEKLAEVIGKEKIKMGGIEITVST